MTAPVLAGAARAYANYGRWVADCPRPYCTNAMALERWQRTFTCEGPDACWITAPVLWPADPAAIEAVLLMRPAVATRNWEGEPITDLLAENAAHGCLPDEWRALAEAAPNGALDLLVVEDGRVVGGLLLPQIEALRLREIED